MFSILQNWVLISSRMNWDLHEVLNWIVKSRFVRKQSMYITYDKSQCSRPCRRTVFKLFGTCSTLLLRGCNIAFVVDKRYESHSFWITERSLILTGKASAAQWWLQQEQNSDRWMGVVLTFMKLWKSVGNPCKCTFAIAEVCTLLLRHRQFMWR